MCGATEIAYVQVTTRCAVLSTAMVPPVEPMSAAAVECLGYHGPSELHTPCQYCISHIVAYAMPVPHTAHSSKSYASATSSSISSASTTHRIRVADAMTEPEILGSTTPSKPPAIRAYAATRFLVYGGLGCLTYTAQDGRYSATAALTVGYATTGGTGWKRRGQNLSGACPIAAYAIPLPHKAM
eukprot:2271869-Rhodomonas_salina.1